MKPDFKDIVLTVLLLLTGITLSIVAVLQHYPGWTGDAFEYAMMLESFFNHFSPELQAADIESFKYHHGKVYEWCMQHFGNELIYNKKPFENACGYFTSLNGAHYSYHFWFYSLLSFPAKFFVHLIGIKKSLAFGITHAIITWLFLWYLFRNKTYSTERKILFLLCFVFSPALFYFKWIHTEYLGCLFIFWSFLLFNEKKYYPAIFLSAVAAIHAPPVAFFTLLLVFHTIYKNGFNFRNLLFCGISSVWVIAPSLFYYWKFGIPNLIIHAGYVDNSSVTFSKFLSFFFDLNQGMIIAVAPFMLAFAVLYLKNILTHPRNWNFDLVILPLIIAMVFGSLGMVNWNHGHAVFIRYGSWISIFMIAYCAMHFDLGKKHLKIFAAIVVLLQSLLVIGYGGFYPDNGMYVKHRKLARFAMNHFPDCYNPEPEIFIERILGTETYIGEGADAQSYYTPDWKLKKTIVRKEKIENNDTTGLNISSGRLVKKGDWYYINY